MARRNVRQKSNGNTKKVARHQLSQKRIELKKNLVERKRGVVTGSLESLTLQAQAAASSFTEESLTKETIEKTPWSVNDNSRKAYMKELRKVVDNADVILEVLDARDPLGCRNREIEDQIVSCSGKRLVLILNKIDLVPSHVLMPWLNELRKDFPTVAFKASTQDQGRHLAQTNGKADKAVTKVIQSSRAVGTDTLMQLLKNYCRKNQMKTAITVGIIGFPNVGKSSLINSLKRNKAVGVSSTAGYTKVMQEIHLDKKIKLLDCPGIVFDQSDAGTLLLRNCLNTEMLNDPVPAVEVILSRCTYEQINALYQVKPFTDVVQFLVEFAQKRGKLSRGGLPDLKAAGRKILQDWNTGRIPFYTEPPAPDTDVVLDTQLMTQFSSEFDLEKVLNPTTEKIHDAPNRPVCSVLLNQSSCTPVVEKTKVHVDHNPVDIEDTLNPQTARTARRTAKQMRKDKRRLKRRLDQDQENEFCETLSMFTLNP